MKLVIVESPAKCKKIEDYLGAGYRCMASYGHLRILNDLSQINVAAGYVATYRPDPSSKKRQHISVLRKAIDAAEEVILATDDDREGEAIAWHLCDMFGLSPVTTPRIIFHEITKPAVLAAIAAPRTIDMHMVAAQQARQIMDLLVGFKITPVLWRCLCANKENPLSAGRCQTPALRLVFENDRIIRNTIVDTEPSYKVVSGFFLYQHGLIAIVQFELNEMLAGDCVAPFLKASQTHQHLFLGCTAPQRGVRQPPMPLTTSRLQQAANNELHWGVKKTMQVAQILYEGGYITYMRTDSQAYSPVFIAAATKYITTQWGKDFVGNGRSGTATAKAHEAIRPTAATLSPNAAKAKMDDKVYQLYVLIWKHTMASLMAPATVETITATISAPNVGNGNNGQPIYRHTCEQSVFLGWRVVYNDNMVLGRHAPTPLPEWHLLQNTAQQTPTQFEKITATPTFKLPPHHYTEAHLVKLLEEMGIGRPSTFASLVDKIQEREYVTKDNLEAKKVNCVSYSLSQDMMQITTTPTIMPVGGEKNKLILQPIGRIVSDFLDAHFGNILNYEYTRTMETALDQVAAGERTLADVCKTCDDGIATQLAAIKAAAIKKVAHKFANGMELVIGRQGPVINAPLPTQHFIPLREPYCNMCDLEFIARIKRGEIMVGDLVDESVDISDIAATTMAAPLGAAVPSFIDMGEWEGKRLFIKTGKFGPYISAMPMPMPMPDATAKKRAPKKADCITKSLNILGVRPINKYTREEVVAVMEGTAVNVNVLRTFGLIKPEVLSMRRGPKGTAYIYFKTTDMKKPAFYKFKGFLEDPLTCDTAVLFDWIMKKHENIAAAVNKG